MKTCDRTLKACWGKTSGKTIELDKSIFRSRLYMILTFLYLIAWGIFNLYYDRYGGGPERNEIEDFDNTIARLVLSAIPLLFIFVLQFRSGRLYSEFAHDIMSLKFELGCYTDVMDNNPRLGSLFTMKAGLADMDDLMKNLRGELASQQSGEKPLKTTWQKGVQEALECINRELRPFGEKIVL